jgi:hypothetical protein
MRASNAFYSKLSEYLNLARAYISSLSSFIAVD